MEDEIRTDLEELLTQAESEGLTAETYYHRGSPYEEIVAYANEIDADLIVMGKHGEGESERLHIGSVADRVLRTAHCGLHGLPGIDGRDDTASGGLSRVRSA